MGSFLPRLNSEALSLRHSLLGYRTLGDRRAGPRAAPDAPTVFQKLCLTLCMCVRVFSRFSCVRPFVTLWTIACQAPLSMGFSRQEYWSGLPCAPPGLLDLSLLKNHCRFPSYLSAQEESDDHCGLIKNFLRALRPHIL